MGAVVSLAKSYVIGERESGVMKAADEATRSNLLTVEDYQTVFTSAGAVEPIYDPEMLTMIFEHSNSLRQNVDSYATNIDGFGHRFDPFIDLEGIDVDERIRTAMLADSQRSSRMARVPSDEEVAATKDEIKAVMRAERARLEHFFEYASADTSFVTLRRRTRQDLEVIGNAYWEVLRSSDGEVARFVYVTAFTMRLMPLGRDAVTFVERMRASDLSFANVPVTQRVRKYVQIVEGKLVFFKEFGDPRVMSSHTGNYFEDDQAMQIAEPGARAATEVIHFKIHSPRSPYGVPRWIGNLLSVVGSRQAEEVNFTYFENKSVPPLAVLVTGGRMSGDSVKRVESYIQNNIKGKRNFHKILVLEAEAPGGNSTDNGRMKIDIKPLTGAQHSDALFQNYDERNIDKVGGSFRLPRLLRGDIRDFNRSTADAALTFAEMQVFQPERQEFDFIINRKIIASMGVKFWKFVSLAPVMRDPAAMSEIIRNLSNANVLTPEECRQLAGDVFNRDFRHIRAPWVKQPAALTLAGIPVDEGEVVPGDEEPADAPKPEPAGVTARAPHPPNPALEARALARKRGKAKGSEYEAAALSLIALRNALEKAESDAFMREQLADARGPQ
jgi:PBSX family phage portal protein